MQHAGNIKEEHKVFIVDAHPIVCDALTQLINMEKDLKVVGKEGDVPNALQAIAEKKPDIVIVDLSLKNASGISLIESLSYSNPELPVLVFSMNDESIYAERCLNIGAKGYIMKKDHPEKIISALRTILGGDIYISDALTKSILHKFVNNKFKGSDSCTEILGNRELEVYRLLGNGFKKEEIADQLNVSINTLENDIRDIKRKMNLNSLREITVHAVRFNNRIIQ